MTGTLLTFLIPWFRTVCHIFMLINPSSKNHSAVQLVVPQPLEHLHEQVALATPSTKTWKFTFGSSASCCAVTTHCFFYRAGVGSALEGGRGRAGTKLFQDFQMLSRIWTHPWCLQLDYISKENKVNEQRHTTGELQASLPSSALKKNPGEHWSFLTVITFCALSVMPNTTAWL